MGCGEIISGVCLCFPLFVFTCTVYTRNHGGESNLILSSDIMIIMLRSTAVLYCAVLNASLKLLKFNKWKELWLEGKERKGKETIKRI